VDSFVRNMPLWKLQTVGGQKLDFLYDNIGRGRQITLKPGVACCLRKHYSMVADLVRGAWARYVRRFNTDLLGEQADLGEFLFGSERAIIRQIPKTQRWADSPAVVSVLFAVHLLRHRLLRSPALRLQGLRQAHHDVHGHADISGPFFYLMGCQVQKTESVHEDAPRFRAHHGALDGTHDYFVLE